MSASLFIAFAFVFVWGAARQTHGSFVDGLQCHRLVPSTATYWFSPCRYPCIVAQLDQSYKIAMQPEPDGTLCRYVGRCSGGICLDVWNKAVLQHFNWYPSFETTSYHNSNDVNRNNYGTDTYVVGSAPYSRTGFFTEKNTIGYANQAKNVMGEVYNTIPYSQKKGTLNVLRRLLRQKRSPRANRRYNRRRTVRNNRLTGSSIRHGDRFSYHDNTWQRQSVTHSPQHGPYNPTVIILNQGKKKRSRLGSTLGTAAVGAVAGAAAGAGAVAVASHLSKSKKEPTVIPGEENKESNRLNQDKVEGTKHEKVEKPEGKANMGSEVDEGSEKKKPSETDGNAKTESTDNGITENEKDIPTGSKTSTGKNSETDLENKGEVSNTKMLKVGYTDDDSGKSSAKHDDTKSEHNNKTEGAEAIAKESGGKDAAEKKEIGEDDTNDKATDKIAIIEGAKTNTTKSSSGTNTDETEKTETHKKDKKRGGIFRRILRKIFQ